jgi:DNA-directed RNA polymerase specialized sigma subunit
MARFPVSIPADRDVGHLLSDLGSQRSVLLRRAILNLEEQERLVLALTYIEGLNVRQIAEVLDLSASRIYQVRSAAMRKLRPDTGGALALAA